MKKSSKNNINLINLLLWVTMALSSCSKHIEHAETYTCPMHPTVVQNRPGVCPVCGMDLVHKTSAGEDVEITEDLSKLLKSPNEIVISSIKIVQAAYKKLPVTVKAQGVVTYDPRQIYVVTARVSGRIEKSYINFSFQQVIKGQKIADIYSPELITAQRNLIYLIDNEPNNTELIQAAKNKISLLGLSEIKINTLIQRKEVSNVFSVYSPYTGYNITQDAPNIKEEVLNENSDVEESMDAMRSYTTSPGKAANQDLPSSTLLREGDYFSAGQTLVKLVSPSSLRIEIDVPTSKAGTIEKGTNIELDFSPGKKLATRIDHIQPFFKEGEAFIKLIIYTNQVEEVRIGQLVDATLNLTGAESLWIPKSAVIDLGLNHVVFVKNRGTFKPIKVTTGVIADGWVEVKQGVTTSDELASNAQYLIDSESFIKSR